MKFYNQSGASLQRTQLTQSDHICTCCQSFDHAAQTMHHDDAECHKCHELCCCGCHRTVRSDPEETAGDQ